MKYGLSLITIERICHIFQNYPQIESAILFGSRAKGNYNPGSDIDIALKGDLTFHDIVTIGVRIDDLDLAYKVDLINYNTINDKDVVAHIDRVGIPFCVL